MPTYDQIKEAKAIEDKYVSGAKEEKIKEEQLRKSGCFGHSTDQRVDSILGTMEKVQASHKKEMAGLEKQLRERVKENVERVEKENVKELWTHDRKQQSRGSYCIRCLRF